MYFNLKIFNFNFSKIIFHHVIQIEKKPYFTLGALHMKLICDHLSPQI